ncbi:type IV pilus assembly protein PilE [Pseudoxanthomonas sp. CF385]|uniref:type IV pilin protein n=1 Tax=Pseudoxanthomonas sp. CF385 TaxID=1881042 RepID=UPI00088080B1|nr:type IV pilin protein [Pseudoxanthomonas sp. CF385]SDQ93778.1 type IV pilus assembly protein PilE [Pseudoxanthomonas sp. CF385]
MHTIFRRIRRPVSLATRDAAGFTLIELLITIAIVAILATIAYSTYQDFIVRSRRAAGAACLQERAQFMERFYTTNLAYVSAAGVAAPIAQCDAEISPHYQIQYQVTPTAAAPRVYTLRAVPQAGQATRDTACGTLTITQAGVRGRTGAAPVTDCW